MVPGRFVGNIPALSDQLHNMQKIKSDQGPSKRPKLGPDLQVTVTGAKLPAHPPNAASPFPKAELTEGLKGPCDQCGSADPESDEFAKDQVFIWV